MAFSIKFDLFGHLGEERIKRVREGMKAGGAKMTAVLGRIGKAVLAQNKRKFDEARGMSLSGVSFGGGITWRHLTLDYFYRKQRKGFSDWLMMRQGVVRRSLTVKGDPANVFRATGTHVEVGSRSPVVGYQWVPRRSVFLTRDDGDELREEITSELQSFWTGDLTRVREAYARRKAAEAASDAG